MLLQCMFLGYGPTCDCTRCLLSIVLHSLQVISLTLLLCKASAPCGSSYFVCCEKEFVPLSVFHSCSIQSGYSFPLHMNPVDIFLGCCHVFTFFSDGGDVLIFIFTCTRGEVALILLLWVRLLLSWGRWHS